MSLKMSKDDQYPVNSTALAKFVSERMKDLRLSTHEVARRCKQAGPEFQISHSTVWHASTGRWRYATPQTLRSLAYGLQVSEDVLVAIARGKSAPESSILEMRQITIPDTLWQKFDEDARRCRRSVDQHLEAILAAYFGEDVNINKADLALIHIPAFDAGEYDDLTS